MAEQAVAEALVVVDEVEVAARGASGSRQARRLKASGSGNVPVENWRDLDEVRASA